jgi:tetratricopeptide (TPR) repeat protein
MAAEMLADPDAATATKARWPVVALFASVVLALAAWGLLGLRPPGRTLRTAVSPVAPAEHVRSQKALAREALANAQSLRTGGNPSGALAKVAEALALDPDLAEAYQIRAAIRAAQGETDAALRALDAYLKLRPNLLAMASQIDGDAELVLLWKAPSFQRWAALNNLPSRPDRGRASAAPDSPAPKQRARSIRKSKPPALRTRRDRRGTVPAAVEPRHPASPIRRAPARSEDRSVNPLGIDPDL